jgi:hypothetical protein
MYGRGAAKAYPCPSREDSCLAVDLLLLEEIHIQVAMTLQPGWTPIRKNWRAANNATLTIVLLLVAH